MFEGHPLQDRVILIENTMNKNVDEINVALESLEKSIKQYGESIKDMSVKTASTTTEIDLMNKLVEHMSSVLNYAEINAKENTISIDALKNNSLIAIKSTSDAIFEHGEEAKSALERSKCKLWVINLNSINIFSANVMCYIWVGRCMAIGYIIT